jgi:aminoglycoside phosphotransferase (APT) family kinase protein
MTRLSLWLTWFSDAFSPPGRAETRLSSRPPLPDDVPVNAKRMHADEVDTDAALVQRLLAGQFPRWAELPIERVSSYGTDHAIYRIGSGLAARLPRIASATRQAAMEATWLPRFAPQLPLRVPAQLATGRPAEGYPFTWSVYEWLPGENANGTITDLVQAAADLAAFITALHGIGTAGAPPHSPSGRGGPLAVQDERVRASIAQLGDRIDGTAALRSWAESLGAPPWQGPHVWLHGDLLPGNLLVVDGRLSAVIDFGTLQVGDPAGDLQPAWNVFEGESRARFRAEVSADDACWLRGRGTVLYQTVMALAYYWDTNPGMITQASRGLAQVLADR